MRRALTGNCANEQLKPMKVLLTVVRFRRGGFRGPARMLYHGKLRLTEAIEYIRRTPQYTGKRAYRGKRGQEVHSIILPNRELKKLARAGRTRKRRSAFSCPHRLVRRPQR
jgi:hypothetical protein